MDLTDLISPNNYVGQNFPLGMESADGGDDPLAKLRELLGGMSDNGALPVNEQPTRGMLPPDEAPTDISARTRQPLSVPLPTPRPADAPQGMLASPADITAFAPTDIQRAQMGRPPIPQTTADLVSAITGRTQQGPTVNKLLASLGGGLSTVTGNTAGGAFARAMGGGLKAGNEADKTNSDDAVKHLKAAIEAQQLGDKQAYTKALTSYYQVLTKQKNEQENVAAAGPKPPRAIDGRLIFDKAERAIQNSNRAIDGDFRLKPEERAQKKAQEAARIYKGFGLNPDGTMPGGSSAPAPSAPSSKKAGNPDEIAFNGDGTQAAPYEPRTKDDYDQIESGSYYIVNGQLRRKK